jgi:hypothetical protein
MRYYYVIICLLIVTGCTRIQAANNEEPTEIPVTTSKLTDIDQLIRKSKITKHIADSISQASDIAVNKKVDKHIKVVTVLKYKIVELKQTNEVLKVKIDNIDTHDNIGKPYNLLPISYSKDHR